MQDEQYLGDVCQCLTDFQTNLIISRCNPLWNFAVMFEVWHDPEPKQENDLDH